MTVLLPYAISIQISCSDSEEFSSGFIREDAGDFCFIFHSHLKKSLQRVPSEYF